MVESFLDTDLNDLLRKGYAELETALQQEEVAEKELALCQTRVAKLSQKIIQLAIASDDKTLIDAVRETGLTDALRSVLKAADKHLTAPEIRTRLEQIGYDVSVYQNFLATLYLTLQRLQKQKEVQEIKHEGKKVYFWQFTKGDDPIADALRGSGFAKRFMEGQKRLKEFKVPEVPGADTIRPRRKS